MMHAYEAVRGELEKYGRGLAEKEEIIVLTKTDVTDEKVIASTKKKFEKLGKPVFVLTLFDDATVKEFSDELLKLLKR
jgi:GTP-binding protein